MVDPASDGHLQFIIRFVSDMIHDVSRIPLLDVVSMEL